MGQFRKQAKTLIVNSADQLEVSKVGGGAVVDNTDTVIALGGFLDILYTTAFTGAAPQGKPKMLAAAVKAVATNHAKEVKTFTVTTTALEEPRSFYVPVTSIDGSEAEYHRDPKRKYYQVGPAASAAAIATAIAAAINQDENAQVTASAAAAVVTLTAKDFNRKIDLFSDGITFTKAVTTAGALGRGTYDVLKNVQWSNPIYNACEFDRRSEYMPQKGAKYTEYRFSAATDVSYLGTQDVADADNGRKSESDYILYINESLTGLIEALDFAIGREAA